MLKVHQLPLSECIFTCVSLEIRKMSTVRHILGKVRYTVQHRPLVKGMLVYFTTWPIGSFIQQKVDAEELSVWRMVKFSLYGSLYAAPGLYGWMKLSCFIWPKPTFLSIVTKAYVEQLTYGPFSICSFLFIMTLFEGGSMRDGKKEISEKFFSTWKVSAIMWPVIQTINYSFIPEKNRVPFIGLCSLLWTIFLTFVKYEPVEVNETKVED